jgi:hypothetical protein
MAQVFGELLFGTCTIRLGAASADELPPIENNPTAPRTLIKPQARCVTLSTHVN